jgi:hypothetical protein
LCLTRCHRAALLTSFDVHLLMLEYISVIVAPDVLNLSPNCCQQSARLNDIQQDVLNIRYPDPASKLNLLFSLNWTFPLQKAKFAISQWHAEISDKKRWVFAF